MSPSDRNSPPPRRSSQTVLPGIQQILNGVESDQARGPQDLHVQLSYSPADRGHSSHSDYYADQHDRRGQYYQASSRSHQSNGPAQQWSRTVDHTGRPSIPSLFGNDQPASPSYHYQSHDASRSAGHNYPPNSYHSGAYQQGYNGSLGPQTTAGYTGHGGHEYAHDMDLGGDYHGEQRSRRRRGNLPRPVTDFLMNWFYEHIDNAYPSEEEKQMFTQRTGLTMTQINNWFINARRRYRDMSPPRH